MNGTVMTFHDSLYSTKDKAVNGKARTYILGSKPNDVERSSITGWLTTSYAFVSLPTTNRRSTKCA
jgi:hypothetical protein